MHMHMRMHMHVHVHVHVRDELSTKIAQCSGDSVRSRALSRSSSSLPATSTLATFLE